MSAPAVFVRGGEVFASSRDVAEVFGKAHKNVLQAIRALECSDDFRRLNFQPTTIREVVGAAQRDMPAFDMTRDGFTFLAMGFTGSEAARFKEAYIAAFNRMEASLRRPQIDVRDPAQMATIAAQLADLTRSLEATVEAQRPKVQAFDTLMASDGLYGLQNAARILGQPPNKFVRWLKREHLFYQGGSLVPRAEHVRRGLFEVKATVIEDKARYRTYVTPKGLEHFAQALGVSGDLFA